MFSCPPMAEKRHTLIHKSQPVHIDVSIEEITHKHIEFGRYKLSSQQTRLSNARTIFREGWSEAALRIIAGSSKVDRNTRKKAMQLLNVGVPYSEKA